MIGLDAADPVLVERWIDDGTLPRLGALRSSGAHGRLRTPASHLAGAPWPTFYTGQPPTHHGIYHDFQWRQESMAYARPTSEWLAARPFWRQLEGEVGVVAYDVPMTLGCEAFPGLEVTGWASHDTLGPPATHPPELIDEIRRRFGAWPMRPESYGASPIDELLELRDHLVDNTARSAELVEWLLGRGPWNLAITVFAAPHRGGHRLWDRSSIAGPVSPEGGRRFDGALRDLYVACDRAVSRLLEAASGDTNVLVFSLHGMMVNTCRVDLLDAMLARVLGGADAAEPRQGFVRKIGERIPLRLRRRLTSLVPAALRDRAMTAWTSGAVDWRRTEAFTLRADLHGYVRINLAGRERDGIVAPRDHDALCARIAEGLTSFVDASTGEPLVEEVVGSGDVFPEGPRRDRLPDLIVRWKDSPAAPHEAVLSDRFGRVERSTPGRIPNARSGNHRTEGFWIAAGPAFRARGLVTERADVLDLAPTALAILETGTRHPICGTPLPILGAAAR
jgi:predicted AlkP superfamily phosphohydrolase/phosphomutase